MALFRRGDRAERTAVYSGVKVIRAYGTGSGQPSYQRTVRIWHGGKGRTRLEFLSAHPRSAGGRGGPGPIVIENGSRHWLYSPRQQAWRPISWCAPTSRVDLLLKNYHLASESVEEIAHRRALRVRIEPRFPGNPSKQSWLDLETGVPLRSDLYDSSGRLVSTSEFLAFRPARTYPGWLFTTPATAGRSEPEPTVEERLSFAPALPHYLPRGYVLDRVTRTRQEGTEVLRARFTDGLNVLSLVQWRGSPGCEPDDGGRERFWRPGEQIHWNIGATRATLSGDLNEGTLRRIAGSVPASRFRSERRIARKHE